MIFSFALIELVLPVIKLPLLAPLPVTALFEILFYCFLMAVFEEFFLLLWPLAEDLTLELLFVCTSELIFYSDDYI
jgi:hypothetical protein